MATRAEVEAVSDALTLHSVQLRRLTQAEVLAVWDLLDGMEARIGGILTEQLARGRGQSWTARRAEALRSEIEAVVSSTYAEIEMRLSYDFTRLAPYEANVNRAIIERQLGVPVTLPPVDQLAKIATTTPFEGKLLGEHISDLEASYFRAVQATVSEGVALGESIPTITSRVLGAGSDVGSLSRREARAVVRTASAHTTGSARTDTYRENDDLIQGEEWSSTLDGRTTLVCIENDGATRGWDDSGWTLVTGGTYEGGYPAHWQERSQLLPWFVGSEGSGGTTYEEWLGRQSPETQDEILGPRRAELWRDGKVEVGSFTDGFGKPYTLEELAEREGIEIP